MSPKFRGLTVVAVLAAILAIGNPGLGEFATYARDRLEATPGMTGIFAGLLPGATRSYVLLHAQRRNFGLFSIYKLDLESPQPVTVVGLLWRFYALGHGFSTEPAGSNDN